MYKRTLAIFLCATAAALSACQRSKSEVSVSTASASTLASSKVNGEPVQPPSVADLREVITRNYKDAVVIDNSENSSFLVGDFNGDQSEDIAIVVKPGKNKLPEINSEYANWILEDPHQVPLPTQRGISKHLPTVVKSNDTLLAVVHGLDRNGWRDRFATQTYLLKNAIGVEWKTEPVAQLIVAHERKSLPVLRGDTIREKISGKSGIIYWTGGNYAWHPLE